MAPVIETPAQDPPTCELPAMPLLFYLSPASPTFTSVHLPLNFVVMHNGDSVCDGVLSTAGSFDCNDGAAVKGNISLQEDDAGEEAELPAERTVHLYHPRGCACRHSHCKQQARACYICKAAHHCEAFREYAHEVLDSGVQSHACACQPL